MTVRFFTDADGFYLGSFWDGTEPPEGAVECSEGRDGHRLVDGAWQPVAKADWVDRLKAPQPVEDWRATAMADAWQIAFVLGEARWQALVFWADGYFNTRILVAKATVIPRASDTVALMAWVLEMDDEDVDTVFRTAATIRA